MAALVPHWSWTDTSGRFGARTLVSIGAVVLLCAVLYGVRMYLSYFAAPSSRLRPGSVYEAIPESAHLHYIELPLDHSDRSAGTFVGYYRVGPDFVPGEDVVFCLTDGQQPLVSPQGIHESLAARLSGLSYIVIGHRGVAPTLFPEVYRTDGSLEIGKALRLYSSWQQVDDIELIRQDAQKRGLLAKDGRIHVMGGSGGGLLVQQYLSKYGKNVRRCLIEVSGSPDVDREHGLTSYCRFEDVAARACPDMVQRFRLARKTGTFDPTSLTFMVQKLPYGRLDAWKVQSEVIDAARKGSYVTYLKYWAQPELNYSLISFLMSGPEMDAIRVRMFEMLGEGLHSYGKGEGEHINLMFEWARDVLKDFLSEAERGAVSVPQFDLRRARAEFDGEALVIAAAQDHVYGTAGAGFLAADFRRSKLLVFDDTHRMQKNPELYAKVRKEFFREGLSSGFLGEVGRGLQRVGQQ